MEPQTEPQEPQTYYLGMHPEQSGSQRETDILTKDHSELHEEGHRTTGHRLFF